MAMDPAAPLLPRLDAAERLQQSGPLGKLLRAPHRMLAARLLSRAAAWRGRPVPLRARTFWGGRMSVQLPDGVSAALYQYRFFEAGLTRIVIAQLKPGMTFFDVGGHFGYFTLLAAHLVGPTGQVHAFEPTPSTYDILSRNAADLPQVRLNQVALYSKADTLTFTAYADQPAYNAIGDGNVAVANEPTVRPTTYQVKAVSMDQYVAETGAKPDLIKLDAEGVEEAILAGMKNTIATCRPKITLEVGDYGTAGRSRKLVESFRAEGYDPMEYDPVGHGLKPHVPHDRPYDYDNLLLAPRA
jgi:FkbM family methyltransferase